MRATTLSERRRLYLLARLVVARHYRRPLTVAVVSRALASSPRQLQRAYAQFGGGTFQEDLFARRMAVALELLARHALPVEDVARLVGYRHRSHFARAFRRRYGISPRRFRERAHHRMLLGLGNVDRMLLGPGNVAGFSHHGFGGEDRSGTSRPAEPRASSQATHGGAEPGERRGGARTGRT